MQASLRPSNNKASKGKDRKDVQESDKSHKPRLTDPNKNKATASSSNAPSSRSRSKSRLPDSSSSSGPSRDRSQSSSRHSSSSASDSSTDPSESIEGQRLVKQLHATLTEWNEEEANAAKKKEKERESSDISLKWHKARKEFELIGSNELRMKTVEKICQKTYIESKQTTWVFNLHRNAVGENYRFEFHSTSDPGTAPITNQDMRKALTKAFITQLEEISNDTKIRYPKDCDGGKYMMEKYREHLKEDGFSMKTGLKGPSITDTEKRRDISYALDALMRNRPLFIDGMLAILLSFYLAYRNVVGVTPFNKFWLQHKLGHFALKYPDEKFPHLKVGNFEKLKDIKCGQMVYIKGPPLAYSFKPTSVYNGLNVLCVEAGSNPKFTAFDSFGVITKTADEFELLMEAEYKELYTHSQLLELYYNYYRIDPKGPKGMNRESELTYGKAWAELKAENGKDNITKALENAKAVEKEVKKSKTDGLNKRCKPEIRIPKAYIDHMSMGCQTVTDWF
jgi:hypothetical protein